MIKLGPRLHAIAGHVLPGGVVADLCCDHARLAAALVERGTVPRAIGVDIQPSPLAAAARMLAEHGLDDRVELRVGDGLSALAPGEAATVVIAGVGATLAERLLDAGALAGSLEGVRRLVVQANHGFPRLGSLRATIDDLGWSIVDETLVRDQGRLYVIMVAEPAEPGTQRLFDARARELGPVLSQAHDPLWPDWRARERERIVQACAAIERAGVDLDAKANRLARYRAYLELLDQAGS